MTKVYRAKCPNCMPEGGAYFERYGVDEKRCQNCYHVLPLRTIKPRGKPTKSQERALNHILKVFGGEATEMRMIGRNLWIQIKNPDRNWISGDSLYGNIGAGGKLDLKLQRFGKDVVIRNEIDVKVYLK